MVRPKTSSKKPQKQRGVDFKKYKRKLGRKLPPAKNATNTEIKSKAIVLPEQSVASEREGLAVSKKGLTLKELLQQTSHHNAKVRRDALIGIRDLASKHPLELKMHKLVIIEKLRERISDEDKVVRETLYQLFKSIIFPGCKEEIPGPIISLIMAYIFNAMTHLAFDIRLMAFKFFELVVQHYPSSFLLHADKVLQSYEDILKKSHTYLQDKSRLKNALGGLVRCLSLFPSAEGQAYLSPEEVGEVFLKVPEENHEGGGWISLAINLKELVLEKRWVGVVKSVYYGVDGDSHDHSALLDMKVQGKNGVLEGDLSTMKGGRWWVGEKSKGGEGGKLIKVGEASGKQVLDMQEVSSKSKDLVLGVSDDNKVRWTKAVVVVVSREQREWKWVGETIRYHFGIRGGIEVNFFPEDRAVMFLTDDGARTRLVDRGCLLIRGVQIAFDQYFEREERWMYVLRLPYHLWSVKPS